MKLSRWLIALTAAAVACLPVAVQAQIPLTPGGSVIPNVFLPPRGTVLASRVGSFNTLGLAGSYASAVILNEIGTLDFYYQVTENFRATDPVASVINHGFGTSATSVFYRTDNGPGGFGFTFGTEDPDLASRSATGDDVTFTFLSTGPGGLVGPDELSHILVIRTDAVEFTDGFTTFAGVSAFTVPTFSPAAVPESASPFFLGALLAGGLILRLRWRQG